MANVLDFLIKLTDMLTPGMRQAASVSNSSTAAIQSNMERVYGGSKRMAASIDELKSRLEGVNKVRFSTTIVKEFDDATRAARKLESEIDRLESKGQKKGGLLGGLFKEILPAAGIAGIMAFAGSSANAAMDFTTKQKTFGVLTGSEQRGNELSKQLFDLKQNTIMGASVYGNAQTMMGFGIGDKEVIKDLRMIGDVALGNKDRMQSLTLAFSQTRASGKLMGQDLLQYINAGFNPLQVMSERWKDFGLKAPATVGQLKEMMEKGQISAAAVTKSFELATGAGGRFHGMMDTIAGTSAGKLMMLEGHFAAFKISVGNALMPIVDLLIKGATHVLEFVNALINGSPVAWAFVVAIGGIAAAIYAQTIATNIATFATSLWAGAQALLNTIMKANPIIFIISLLIALGLWIYSIVKKYDGWGKSMQGLWEIIKGFTKLAWYSFKSMAENIWYHVEYVWFKIKGFVEWIAGAFGNVWNAIKLAAQFKFGEAKQALFAEIKVSATKDIEDLEKRHKQGELQNAKSIEDAYKQMNVGRNMIGLTKKPEAGGTVNPVTANAAGAGSDGNTGGLINDPTKADKINGGGQRNITITIAKQIEKLEVHVMNAKEGAEEIANIIREETRKIMYSLNGETAN